MDTILNDKYLENLHTQYHRWCHVGQTIIDFAEVDKDPKASIHQNSDDIQKHSFKFKVAVHCSNNNHHYVFMLPTITNPVNYLLWDGVEGNQSHIGGPPEPA